MSRIRSAALAAALLVGLTATAHAQSTQPQPGGGPPGQMGGRGGRGASMLLRGITLSSAQQTKVDQINEKYRGERQSLMQGGGGFRDSTTRAQMMSLMQKEQGELRAVLTADQLKQFDQNLAEMRQRMQERGRGPGAGGPPPAN